MAGILKKLKTHPVVNPAWAILGVLPAVLAVTLFSLFPAALNLVISFTDYNGVAAGTKFIGFGNYASFFTVINNQVLPAFWTTIKYSLLMVVPLQIISLGAALLVNKGLKGSNLFRAVFFMPSILGAVVICASWKLIFDPLDGPLARYFHIDSAFLGDERFALVYIAVIALWASFGYSMVIYIAGLQNIPRDYYEAAMIDGASPRATFFRITLPLLKPAVTICLWIAISGTLGMADYIMLTTGGGHNTMTIGYYIFTSVIGNTVSQGQSAATAIYFFLFVTAIMLAFNFLMKRRSTEL
ncbi:MAG: sugar ABC transporter permease [Clostridiales bacterium]|jgi:raffinose/stachyose/melibiose transport system permease protein|nr:sugar ABC transporter permease [Clostridiales bacterium]